MLRDATSLYCGVPAIACFVFGIVNRPCHLNLPFFECALVYSFLALPIVAGLLLALPAWLVGTTKLCVL